MEYCTIADERCILISSHIDVKDIISKIAEKNPFASLFRFSDRKFFISLLKLLNISYDEFTKKYFYYDRIRNIHISESEFGYIWISTYGLIARKKQTSNGSVNSCLSQYTVISLLISRAIEVVKEKDVYDIDSYNFDLLNELSPAIFHNITFYIEILCKSYLSLSNIAIPRSHKLKYIYKKTMETMMNNKHNNSLFQILILDPLYKIVDHIDRLPAEFKEQFIKYDDNAMDNTIILFEQSRLYQMLNLLELSRDFITDYFEKGAKTHYLKSNLYKRLLEQAKTDERKKRIDELYPHLKELI